MALSTYSELQSAVAEWLERGDLVSRIPDFIRLAEGQLNRLLRNKPQERRSTAIISDPFSATPPDLLETQQITMSDGSEAWDLEPETAETLAVNAARSPQPGRPRYWTQVGAEYQYFPPPDQPYTATLIYLRGLTPLSDSAPSNWLLADHPDAYLFGALKEAGPFLRDPELTATFEAKYRAAADEINASDRTIVGRLRSDPALTRMGRQSYDITRG